MKKFIILLATILSLSVIMSACAVSNSSASGSAKAGQEKDYDSMKEIQGPEGISPDSVLGISPDGKSLLVMKSENQIGIVNIESGEETATIDSPDRITKMKQAAWSKDGKRFILGDTGYVAVEEQNMISFNFDCYSIEKAESVGATDESAIGKSIMKDGALIFSPSWSADNNGMLYSYVDKDGINICKVDIKSGEKTVIYNSRDRSGFEQAIELKDGLLLCEHNGAKKGDNDVFMYDAKKDEETSLDGIIDNGKDDPPAIYEIKNWSEDRRTVLVNKWELGPQGTSIGKISIVSFNGSFSDYKIKTLEYASGYQTDAATASAKTDNGKIARSSKLSPDGRYLLVCEEKTSTADSSADVSLKRQLVLYDLVKDKDYVLLEVDPSDPLGLSGPRLESLFMTKNGVLMVYTGEGYKLYQLK